MPPYDPEPGLTDGPLSSRATFFVKFLSPALFVAITGGFTFAAFSGRLLQRNGEAVPPQLGYFFLGLFVIALLISWRWFGAVKKVSVEGDQLVISNYMYEIRVRLSQVESVKESKWRRDRPIKIRFATETEFGREVLFLPRQYPWTPWKSNPLVDQLQRAADRSRRRAAAR